MQFVSKPLKIHVSYLHSWFFKALIWGIIWKTSVLMFNYILHFRSSSLQYLQFFHVRFLVMTPHLCLVFQPLHNQGFIQPQYYTFNFVSVDYSYCPCCIKSWIILFCYSPTPALCLEGFAVITYKFISPPLTLNMDKTPKNEHIENRRENGLRALLGLYH